MGLRGVRPKRTCPRALRALALNPAARLQAWRGDALEQAEIAAILGITQQGVQQTIDRALRKLRALSSAELAELFRAWSES
jgi:DNA-binding CsgD family transcriptional regulator